MCCTERGGRESPRACVLDSECVYGLECVLIKHMYGRDAKKQDDLIALVYILSQSHRIDLVGVCTNGRQEQS